MVFVSSSSHCCCRLLAIVKPLGLIWRIGAREAFIIIINFNGHIHALLSR